MQVRIRGRNRLATIGAVAAAGLLPLAGAVALPASAGTGEDSASVAEGPDGDLLSDQVAADGDWKMWKKKKFPW